MHPPTKLLKLLSSSWKTELSWRRCWSSSRTHSATFFWAHFTLYSIADVVVDVDVCPICIVHSALCGVGLRCIVQTVNWKYLCVYATMSQYWWCWCLPSCIVHCAALVFVALCKPSRSVSCGQSPYRANRPHLFANIAQFEQSCPSFRRNFSCQLLFWTSSK